MRRSGGFSTILRTAAMPLLAGGSALLALDIARRIFRRSQLFCPDIEPVKSWNPADYGLRENRVTEHWFETPDGEMLFGWYCRAEKPIASALFCHGNSGNLTTVAEVMPHLLNAGFNVFLFDYRGFGKSSGTPSLSGVIADAITAARFHDHIRPKHLPSLLYGYSLGGAIAAQVIRRHAFDGLILQSTFTNLPDIARTTFPRLPMHLLAGSVFDTLDVVRQMKVPLLILHGEQDEAVPCWMAHRIFECCEAPKRIHIVPGGLHKDLYVRDGDALVWLLNQFVADLPPGGGAHIPLDQPAPIDDWVDLAFRALRRKTRRRTAPESL